jgi:mRNA-degrading endonuclease toxin of MazEF toxin-antitoxin module
MRPIHLARLDGTRPVLVLTRAFATPHLTRVTVAPITSRLLPEQEAALTDAIQAAFDLA